MSHGTNECYRVYDAAYDQNTANIRSSVPKTIHLSGLHPLSMKKFFNKGAPLLWEKAAKGVEQERTGQQISLKECGISVKAMSTMLKDTSKVSK